MPMTLATFMDIFDIWSFHVMFWSSVIHKKLKLVTCSTGLPLIEILSFGIVRGCLKNIMNFDLATFNPIRSGGALKAPPPMIFCSHALNIGAALLCVGDFSQKIV